MMSGKRMINLFPFRSETEYNKAIKLSKKERTFQRTLQYLKSLSGSSVSLGEIDTHTGMIYPT